jgi:hypothetical protein
MSAGDTLFGTVLRHLERHFWTKLFWARFITVLASSFPFFVWRTISGAFVRNGSSTWWTV